MATLLSTFPSLVTRPIHPAVRIDSIDVLRALTMVLMVFVNDLGSLRDIPAWLEHVPGGVDGIGLADVVFPAFLFIVGMSVPFAIQHRRYRGEPDEAIAGHILSRSGALLLMGLFLVNGEYLNEAATGIKSVIWNVLACTSFILVWNAYPQTMSKTLVAVTKLTGLAILLTLAIVCRSGEGELVGHFTTYWWGILGLIGWSYLTGALITLWAHDRIGILAFAWVCFCLLSMAAQAHWLPNFLLYIPAPISGGTMAGLTVGGSLTATVFKRCLEQRQTKNMTIGFLLVAVCLIALSIYTRLFWGLSKLGATPAWLFLCSAFTLLAFTGLYWLVDAGGKGHWFRLIKPAGTGTLLCYLIPYFAYAGMVLLNLSLPAIVMTGGIGLLKSFLFALFCVWITGRLNRMGIKLKL